MQARKYGGEVSSSVCTLGYPSVCTIDGKKSSRTASAISPEDLLRLDGHVVLTGETHADDSTCQD